MTSPTPTRRRRLIAAATTLALAVGVVGALSPATPAGAAPGSGTGSAGQQLTVSKVDGLDPDGETVTVTGSGYTAAAGFDIATEGMYLALCVDNGPGQQPTPCIGGADTGGETSASRWVTNNPYQGTPAVSVGADGSFTTTLTLTAADANTDCNDLPVGKSCKVFTRMDHRATPDRSQDVRVPVSFAAPQTGARLQVSPAAGLFDEPQDVVVTGTGYPTTGPGLYVVFGPQPQNNLDATMYGAQAFVPSSAIAADGSFTITLEGVDPTYTGEDDEDYDFRSGGGYISTMRAHGVPDLTGEWLRSKAVSFRARTAVESFVTAAHTDFLGEAPTRTELNTDTAKLNQGQSKARYLKDLSTSDAWLAGVVNKLYQDTLGRNGGPNEIAYWAGRIRGGLSVASAAASFYASAEYFNGIGGGTNLSWIKDLYQKVLLRTGSSADHQWWAGQVAARGRTKIALQIYQSNESARTRVKGLYQTLLGRNAEPAGLTFWAGEVVKKGDLALAVSLANSPEYGNRAKIRFP